MKLLFEPNLDDEVLEDLRDTRPGVRAGTEGRLQAKNDKWNRK